MIYLLSFAVPCLWLAWRGYRAGALAAFLRLVSLLGAYGAAWWAAPLLVPMIRRWHGLPMEILALPAAGLLVFALASVMLALLVTVIRRQLGEERLSAARPLGALMGAIAGGVLGLLLVWFAGVMTPLLKSGEGESSTVQAAKAMDQPVVLQQMDTGLRDLSADMVGSVAGSVMGNSPAAPLVREVLVEPLTVAEGLRRLTAHAAVQKLFSQPDSLAVLEAGNVQQIVRLPAFRELLADAALMQFLVSVGLPGATDEARAAALAEKFSLCTRNMARLRNSDEFRAMISDPELQGQMQRRDLFALLGNAKVRRLVDMLSQGGVAASPSADGMRADATRREALPVAKNPDDRRVAERLDELVRQSNTPAEKRTIYKWHDTAGRQHFGYDKPPQGVPFEVIGQ